MRPFVTRQSMGFQGTPPPPLPQTHTHTHTPLGIATAMIVITYHDTNVIREFITLVIHIHQR